MALIRKVEKVEIVTRSGRILKVVPHLLSDLAKFEAGPARPKIKPTPKELQGIPAGAKPSILPKMVLAAEPAPEPAPIPEEVKTRKAPVRSKAKK